MIEPNEEHQVLSTMALGRRGFRVTIAGTGRDGIRLALSQPFDLIVLDSKLRDLAPFDVLSVLATRVSDVPKVFVVTAGQEQTAVRALASGASGFLVKTARYNELLPSEVENQLRAAKARRSLREQKRALGESEERFQKAFRASPVAIALATREDGRFLDANDAMLRFLGYAKDDFVNRTYRELGIFPDDSVLEEQRHRILEPVSIADADVPIRTRAGTSRDGKLSVESIDIEGDRCLLLLLRDVTAERRNEKLRVAIYEISEATTAARDLTELYREIQRIVGGFMPADNFYIALYDPATTELSFPYFIDEKEPAPSPYPAGKGLTEYVLRTQEPLLASPEVLDELVAQGKVDKVGAEGVDWLGVPLIAGGRAIGVLAVQSYGAAIRYTPEERDVLSMISTQVALAIDRKRAENARRRAESRFRTMFQDAPMGMALTDPEGRLREMNPAFERMLGYASRELRGKTLLEVTHGEDRAWTHETLSEVAKGSGVSREGETRLLRQDGQTIRVRSTFTKLRSEASEPDTLLAMVEDVTRAKQAQEERDSAGRRFHAMIDKIADGILLVSSEGAITFESSSASRIFGFPPAEVVGHPAFEFVHPDDTAQVATLFKDLMSAPGRTLIAEFRIIHKDGTWRWVEAVGRNLLDDEDIRAIIVNYRDITDRNEALEQIRFQASLLRQVKNAVIATDLELKVVFWNDFAAALFGWTLQETYGRGAEFIGAVENARARAEATVRQVAEHGHWEGEAPMVRKDGTLFPASVALTEVRDRSGTAIGYVAIVSDATERVRARKELELKSRRRAALARLSLRALVEPRLSALMAEAAEVLANELGMEGAAIFERKAEDGVLVLRAEVGGKSALGSEIPPPAAGTLFAAALSSLDPVVVEDARKGTPFPTGGVFPDETAESAIVVGIRDASGPYGLLAVRSSRPRVFSEGDNDLCLSVAGVIADAFQRRQTERLLAEYERNAAVGQLASYVAHEVNTPLTNLSLLTASIARKVSDPEILKKVEAIDVQRRQVSAIITDLLGVPRVRPPRRTPWDLRKVIAEAVEEASPHRRPDVPLQVEAGDGPILAEVDPVQIREVLVHLLRNALQATSQGRVTVRITELPEFLFISVEDTGPGFPRETLERILRPTAEAASTGDSVSPSLAACRDILAAHGGTLEATSQVGKGSTFTVVLPRGTVR